MASCACSGTSDGSVWHAMASEMESEGGVCELGPGTRPACPGRAQETTKLGTTGRCMHADADAAAAGRTSAAQVGRGANTEIIPRRQGALSLSLSIPLHCTRKHCSPLMRPLSSPPLRRFRKHATPRPMCTWTGPSARRWNGSGPIDPRSAFATVRACMYCARVDSVPHFRSAPPRAVTMARMRGRLRRERGRAGLPPVPQIGLARPHEPPAALWKPVDRTPGWPSSHRLNCRVTHGAIGDRPMVCNCAPSNYAIRLRPPAEEKARDRMAAMQTTPRFGKKNSMLLLESNRISFDACRTKQ